MDEDDDDEADYCDAADEEAEAGVLGQIANKINKFENHNQEVEKKHLNERDALKRFIVEAKFKQKKTQKQTKNANGLINDVHILSQVMKGGNDDPFDAYNSKIMQRNNRKDSK